MSIKDQKLQIKKMGSEFRDAADGEELVFEAIDRTVYHVHGVMSGVSQRKAAEEGGVLMAYDGQCRVIKDRLPDGVEPEAGWRVMRASGLGKVYGVEQVAFHDGDLEWRMDLGAL